MSEEISTKDARAGRGGTKIRNLLIISMLLVAVVFVGVTVFGEQTDNDQPVISDVSNN